MMRKLDPEILQSQRRMRHGDETMNRLLNKSQQLLKTNQQKLNTKSLINEHRKQHQRATSSSTPTRSRNREGRSLSPRRSDDNGNSSSHTIDIPNSLHPNLYNSATMRSILGAEPRPIIDFAQSKENISFPKESKMEPNVPIPASTYPKLVKTDPVAHSIDPKLMNSMKSDFGTLYKRHFTGLEV